MMFLLNYLNLFHNSIKKLARATQNLQHLNTRLMESYSRSTSLLQIGSERN